MVYPWEYDGLYGDPCTDETLRVPKNGEHTEHTYFGTSKHLNTGTWRV